MAILIEIHQKFIKHGIYYYEVNDCSNSDEGHFYIGIDAEKKIVNYYSLKNLNMPIGYMDFSESDKFTNILGLDMRTVKWAAFRAYDALIRNVFPKDMSKQS